MIFRRTLIAVLALCAGLLASTSQAVVISAGAPTTTVPTHLSNGSYLGFISVTLGADQFLLPVGINGAANLQTWQFDLTFDSNVVQEVDPGDGTSGIYGAEFTPGDSNSLSFILGGFPLTGLVDDVAGSYPFLLNGVSGSGVLAYILFEFLAGQQTSNPNFSIENAVVQQAVPEPGTLALFAAALILMFTARCLDKCACQTRVSDDQSHECVRGMPCSFSRTHSCARAEIVGGGAAAQVRELGAALTKWLLRQGF